MTAAFKICLLVDDTMASTWMQEAAEHLQDEIAESGKIACFKPSYAATFITPISEIADSDWVVAFSMESTRLGMDIMSALYSQVPVLVLHEKLLAPSNVFSALERTRLLEVGSFMPNDYGSLFARYYDFISSAKKGFKTPTDRDKQFKAPDDPTLFSLLDTAGDRRKSARVDTGMVWD